MYNLDKQYGDGDNISHHCIHSTKRGMATPPMSPSDFPITIA